MKKIVIIFGYNNTRIYDIKRLKTLCKNKFDADILLCKESIGMQDKEITPYVLQIDLEIKDDRIIQHQINEVDHYLQQHNLEPIACLPFSDRGIPLGTHFAKHRNLAHDDCERSYACIDKYTFRCLEANEPAPEWYKKPFFTRIFSYEEAEAIVRSKNRALFFKPTAEGNSRGCIEINSLDDLLHHKDNLAPYYQQGIIIEECIKDCDEYSFDGVNGNYVITEKKTSDGYYRVETQHLLPAPLPRDYYERLIEAGKIVARISGSDMGAVHNELFLNKTTGEVFCVEPNRRPAGLKLWDWIKVAYPETDNWDSWTSWAASIPYNNHNTDIPDFYVGCRMLQASACGTLIVDENSIASLKRREEIVDIVISKPNRSLVTSTLKDNSDFMGYIVCKSKSVIGLRNLLDTISKETLALCNFQ
jgi:hypothetical protein